MNDVLQVSDRITALYLGRVAAEVRPKDVTHGQIVELITSGRSGDIGLTAATAADHDDLRSADMASEAATRTSRS